MGMKPMAQWTAPQPLGDSLEDKMDYYATFVWVLFMLRMALLFYVHGYDETMAQMTEVLGRGALRVIYFVTFFFNTWYYTIVGQTIMANWWHDQQEYEWEFTNL